MDKVPEQTMGKAYDVMEVRSCKDQHEAVLVFQSALTNLKAINLWHSIAESSLSARFYLCDAGGNEVDREPEPSDLIKIDIPGPGGIAGKGFDWVRIEEIDYESNPCQAFFQMQVRPSKCPDAERQDVAHFFDGKATSTFILKRLGVEVIAAIHGRNEVPNDDVDKITDAVRNKVIAELAYFQFSDLQWRSLVKGILQFKI